MVFMNVLEDELQEINKTISVYKQLINKFKQDLQESNKTYHKTVKKYFIIVKYYEQNDYEIHVVELLSKKS